MGEWLQAILLGILEGLTEFLPISSTGHLLIVSKLLHFTAGGGTFEVFIQFGTLLAVLGFYARDLLREARAFPADPRIRRFWLGIILAFIPAAVVGVLARDFIKTVLFASPAVIGWSFIIGGVVLIAVERLPRRAPTTDVVTAVSLRQAFGIGLAQVLSLIPGVSRSGATIVGGMLGGLDRPTATTFSFYLALPTLGAATLYDLARSLHELSASDLGIILVGTVFALIAAAASIGVFLRYVATRTFVPFGIYRIIAGIAVLALVATGVLKS